MKKEDMINTILLQLERRVKNVEDARIILEGSYGTKDYKTASDDYFCALSKASAILDLTYQLELLSLDQNLLVSDRIYA